MQEYLIPIIQMVLTLPSTVLSCLELKEMMNQQIQLHIQYVNRLRDKNGTMLTRDEDIEMFSITKGENKQCNQLSLDNKNLKNVLVAMKFGTETLKLREAIKKGITDAGYNPILIDEVEHNNLITPELFKYIRNSKFVVADLSHQNNGAYFEEGYAMGLGKPVIQLCKKGVELHFDIAQKNTIIWDTESDIPLKLKKRIMATIE